MKEKNDNTLVFINLQKLISSKNYICTMKNKLVIEIFTIISQKSSHETYLNNNSELKE